MVNIDIEGFGRWGLFSNVGNLRDMIEGPVFREIFSQLSEEYPHSELHSLTCGIERFTARSVTLDSYLTKKVIKYKVTGTLKVEAEVIDDFEIDEEVWKDLRKKRHTHWLDWDGNIPFELVIKEDKT